MQPIVYFYYTLLTIAVVLLVIALFCAWRKESQFLKLQKELLLNEEWHKKRNEALLKLQKLPYIDDETDS